MIAAPVFIHAITPLHSGTGQGVDVIDQPVARERATNLPVIPGSSIKGVLRDAFQSDEPEGRRLQHTLFGPPNDNDAGPEENKDQKPDEFAGALQFSDARLLLLPVRSLAATFVWTTCPFVLRRLLRDLRAAFGVPPNGVPGVPAVCETLWLSSGADCLLTVNNQPSMILEDLSAPASGGDTAARAWAKWIAQRLFPNGDAAWQTELAERFAILDDASFTYLAEFATEVAAHVEINDKTGTVDQGKLWYQESLPAETVLVAIVRATKPRRDHPGLPDEAAVLKAFFDKQVPALQFGGKFTTGQGMARLLRANM
jgi:CRISPR-associated protein Cmr4